MGSIVAEKIGAKTFRFALVFPMRLLYSSIA
jgi:hypothetical protein